MGRYKLLTSLLGCKEVNFKFTEIIGDGATATVFKEKIGNEYFAIKKYKDGINLNSAKISAMISGTPTNAIGSVNQPDRPIFAWPLSIVTDTQYAEQTKSIGYVMPLIDAKASKTIDHFYDFTLSKKLQDKSSTALSYRIEILKNLCNSLDGLHKLDHIFIDLKPQNIRSFEKTNQIALLDCDGFSISDKITGKLYNENGVSPDYIAPEVGKADRKTTLIGKEQDYYALSVICFQMLNNGIHPFQGVLEDKSIQANTNDEKSILGLYPHGMAKNKKIKPKGESIHELFLDETRTLFDRAFTTSNNRPSPREWADHFSLILLSKKIIECDKHKRNIEHMRFKGKDCPACYLEKIKNKNLNSRQRKHSKISVTPSVVKISPPTKKNNNLIVYGGIGLLILWGIINNGPHTPNPSGNSSSQFVSVAPDPTADLTDTELCRRSLSADRTWWESNPNLQYFVNAAQKKGFSVADCQRNIGYSSQSSSLKSNSILLKNRTDSDLCNAALNLSKSDWDYSASVELLNEVQKNRNFNIQICRTKLGISDQQNTNSQLKSLTGSEICSLALNLSRTDWDTAANPDLLKEVQVVRNMNLKACKSMIGIFETPTQAVDFKMCNGTRKTIRAAYMHVQNGQYVTEGWYNISAKDCTPFVDDTNDPVYVYAETIDGSQSWSDNDFIGCVTKPPAFRPFSFASNNTSCSGGYQSKGFWKVDIINDPLKTIDFTP